MTRDREVKNLPGGYLPDPPESCDRQVTYKPAGYRPVQVVDYVLCYRCKVHRCETRDKADRARRSRIRATKEGNDGHPVSAS